VARRKKKRSRLPPTLRSSPGSSGATTTVTAISNEEYVFRTRGLRFPPPFAELASDRIGFDHWWSQLQFMFDVDDPRSFLPITTELGSDEKRVLRRYLEAARVLAASTQLSAADRVSVKIERNDDDTFTEEVDAFFSAPDVTAGFLAYFRQLYDPDERASFSRAMAIVMESVSRSSDEATIPQTEELRRWGRMVRKLRAQPKMKLLMQALHEAGEWPALDDHDEASFAGRNPEQLISHYLYGEHIHWDRHAEILDKRKASPFLDAWHRLWFLETVCGLSHAYLGFAALVEAAFPRLQGGNG
jgi:hypothetical protein